MQTIIMAYTLLVAASGLLTQAQGNPNINPKTLIQIETTAQYAIDFANKTINELTTPTMTQDTPLKSIAVGSPTEECTVTPNVEISPAYGKEIGFGGKTKTYSIRITATGNCDHDWYADYKYDGALFKDKKLPFDTQVFNKDEGTYSMDITVHNKDNTVQSTTTIQYEGGKFND